MAEDVAVALQRLAREQMKERLMRDILVDMAVCDIEGWDKLEYIKELKELLDGMVDFDARQTEEMVRNQDAVKGDW